MLDTWSDKKKNASPGSRGREIKAMLSEWVIDEERVQVQSAFAGNARWDKQLGQISALTRCGHGVSDSTNVLRPSASSFILLRQTHHAHS